MAVIVRTAMIDDDGSGEVGTVMNNAWKTEFYNQIDAAIGTSVVDTLPPTNGGVGPANDWNPGLSGGDTLTRWAGASDMTVTGVVGGAPGMRWTFKNVGTKVAYFAHLSGASAAANRFTNWVTSGPLPVAPGGALTYAHDGTNWLLVAHEQGAWITPTYNSANFAPNVGAWLVEAADVSNYSYRVSGRSLTVSWYLQATTVSGLPTVLKITIPNGFTVPVSSLHPIVHDDAGVGNAGSFCLLSATTIDCYKAYGAAAFANATNTTRIFGTVTFQVN